MEFDTEKFSFRSSLDDRLLYSKLYVPKDKIKGTVIIFHGLNDHINRYKELMEHIAENGYVCGGFDMLGHGRSVHSQEELGSFSKKDGYKYIIKDSLRFVKMIKKHFNSLPVFVLGSDFGSSIAKICAAKMPKDISGMILSGFGEFSAKDAITLNSLQKIKKNNGSHYRCDIMTKALVSSLDFHFRNEKGTKSFLSREEKVLLSFESDALCNFVYTAGGLTDVFKVYKISKNKTILPKLDKMLSILALSGDNDAVGDFTKAGKRLYTSLYDKQFADITLRFIEGAKHDIFSDRKKSEAFNEITQWLDDSLEIKANM